MNCCMSCVQCLICKRTPKATGTEYYFDPKIMMLGTPNFEPHKLQNRVSMNEFMAMRHAMIEAGGSWLSAAKCFFVLMVLYCIACTIAGLATGVYKQVIADDPDDFNIPLWLNAAVFVAPNIIFQLCWIISVRKAGKLLERFFEWQNQRYYTARGINWISKGGLLMYIQIKIVKPATPETDNSQNNGQNHRVSQNPQNHAYNHAQRQTQNPVYNNAQGPVYNQAQKHIPNHAQNPAYNQIYIYGQNNARNPVYNNA